MVNNVISNTIVLEITEFTTKLLIWGCSSDEMIGPRIPAAEY